MKEFFKGSEITGIRTYLIPTRSGININQNRQQININIRAADLLNVMIMSEKNKEMFENSC